MGSWQKLTFGKVSRLGSLAEGEEVGGMARFPLTGYRGVVEPSFSCRLPGFKSWFHRKL